MATAMRNKDDHLKENLDGQHRKGLDVCLIVLKEVAFMLCFQSWQLCSEKQLLQLMREAKECSGSELTSLILSQNKFADTLSCQIMATQSA